MRKFIIFCLVFFAFHFSFAQQGTWFWGKCGIGNNWDVSTATDRKGNCYLTSMFQNDTINFGSYIFRNSTVTSPPYSTDEDAYLIKFAPNGNILWATQTFEKNSQNRSGNDAPEVVCTDNFGNVYLSGNFIDTIFIGGSTLTTINSGSNPQNMYLAKYNSNGILRWAKQAICVNDSSLINSLSTSSDSSCNIYIVGCIRDTVKIGSNTLTAPSLGFSSFIAKYDSNGNVVWVRQALWNKSANLAYGVATDKFGSIYVTGEFRDSVTFGNHTVKNSNPNNSDVFLVKYSPNGNVLWAKAGICPIANGAEGAAITTDFSGNIYIDGQFQDTIIFPHDTVIATNSNLSFFLVKYDSSGNELWSKGAKVMDGNAWNAWWNSISSDNSNHIYLTANGIGGGKGTDKIAFAGDTLSVFDTASYDGASVVYKLDSNGNVICSSILSAGSVASSSITSDASGNYVYVGATLGTEAIFGNDTINPFADPIDPQRHVNYFSFIARWQECDSNVLYAGFQNQKPIGGEVTVYPNPNNGMFTLALQNLKEPAQVEIYNMLGENIYEKPLNSNKTVMNLSGQPAGVYFYRVLKEGGVLVGDGKIVLKK